MGTENSQLDIDERYELFRLREAGTAQKKIAVLMNRLESTISRELRRNALPKGGYRPGSVDRIALSRRRRSSKLERLSLLGLLVRDRLAMGWEVVKEYADEGLSGILSIEKIPALNSLIKDAHRIRFDPPSYDLLETLDDIIPHV